jgi:hypothetical protein
MPFSSGSSSPRRTAAMGRQGHITYVHYPCFPFATLIPIASIVWLLLLDCMTYQKLHTWWWSSTSQKTCILINTAVRASYLVLFEIQIIRIWTVKGDGHVSDRTVQIKQGSLPEQSALEIQRLLWQTQLAVVFLYKVGLSPVFPMP